MFEIPCQLVSLANTMAMADRMRALLKSGKGESTWVPTSLSLSKAAKPAPLVVPSSAGGDASAEALRAATQVQQVHADLWRALCDVPVFVSVRGRLGQRLRFIRKAPSYPQLR